MTKLLTDEELRSHLAMKIGYDDGIKGRQAVILLGSDVQDIVELIQANTNKAIGEVLDRLEEKYDKYDPNLYEVVESERKLLNDKEVN